MHSDVLERRRLTQNMCPFEMTESQPPICHTGGELKLRIDERSDVATKFIQRETPNIDI